MDKIEEEDEDAHIQTLQDLKQEEKNQQLQQLEDRLQDQNYLQNREQKDNFLQVDDQPNDVSKSSHMSNQSALAYMPALDDSVNDSRRGRAQNLINALFRLNKARQADELAFEQQDQDSESEQEDQKSLSKKSSKQSKQSKQSKKSIFSKKSQQSQKQQQPVVKSSSNVRSRSHKSKNASLFDDDSSESAGQHHDQDFANNREFFLKDLVQGGSAAVSMIMESEGNVSHRDTRNDQDLKDFIQQIEQSDIKDAKNVQILTNRSKKSSINSFRLSTYNSAHVDNIANRGQQSSKIYGKSAQANILESQTGTDISKPKYQHQQQASLSSQVELTSMQNRPSQLLSGGGMRSSGRQQSLKQFLGPNGESNTITSQDESSSGSGSDSSSSSDQDQQLKQKKPPSKLNYSDSQSSSSGSESSDSNDDDEGSGVRNQPRASQNQFFAKEAAAGHSRQPIQQKGKSNQSESPQKKSYSSPIKSQGKSQGKKQQSESSGSQSSSDNSNDDSGFTSSSGSDSDSGYTNTQKKLTNQNNNRQSPNQKSKK